MNVIGYILATVGALGCSSDRVEVDETETPESFSGENTDTETQTQTEEETEVQTDTYVEPFDPSGLGDGEFVMYFNTSYGSDACLGSVSIDLDAKADPAVMGTATCTFSGFFAEWISGKQTVSIVGDTADGEVMGDMSIDVLGQQITLPWGGTVSDTDLFGAFSDSLDFNIKGIDIAINYEGGFHVVL